MDSSQQQKDTKLEPTENLESSTTRADELIKRVEELDDELEKRLTREISILFTDIRGSTTFFRTHGDIAGRLMMQRHYDMLFPLIKEQEGTIVKTVGDSIMASFDDPYKAVKAAIDMQRTLSDYNSNQPSEELIRIRIGINFGRGIIEDSDVYGNVVNVASKLVSIGESDQILVSESIYENLQLREDLSFLPLQTDHPFPNNLKLKVYAVKWQEEDEMKEGEMTMMSLALMNHTQTITEKDDNEEDDNRTGFFSPIDHVVRDKAFRTTIDPDWRLLAVFENAETAIETSFEIQHIFQQSARDFHIGIHTGLTRVEEVAIHGGEEADEAREKAGINEIYITQPTYELIKDNPYYQSSSLSERLENGTWLYKIFRQTTARGRIEEPYSMDQTESHSECFYCGSRNHHSSSCPSKNLPFHTNSLNEIGYLSPAGIKSLFERHFAKILEPLKPNQDDTFSPSTFDQQSESFKVPFEAFYEVNEVFQLRFLCKMWLSEATDWNNFPLSTPNRRGGGFLWLGEDSLRVSNYKDALTMFNKALEHHVEDYKPYSALGFLAIETGDLVHATYQFRRALTYTDNPLQKSYVLLLLSRTHELRNNIEDAIDKVREALFAAPSFLEAKYRHAVLLAKSGDKDAAISILKNLIAIKPDFYLKILLDPGLTPLRKEIERLTEELFEYAKTQASNSIKTIKGNLIEHGEWFSKEDPEYKNAEKIFNQTIKLLEGNSYFGFLDVIGYSFDIKDKLRSVLKNIRRSVKKSIHSFHTIWKAYDQYLENYCYKNLISYTDTFLLKDYQTILNKAKAASSIESAKSIKEAQNLINELSSLSKKVVNNQKKLNFLRMVYFASGCSCKFIIRFLLWSLLVSTVSCFVLIGYQVYSHSLSDFSTEAIADYLKFSSFFGGLLGAGASIYWLYSHFDHLYAKLK